MSAQLEPVAGPGLLGGGRRRVLELIYLLAVTDFKKAYFGTVFGYLWSLARPLLLFGVLYTVFSQVFRIGSDVPHYPVLLLFNIVLFGFFQEATGVAVTSIVAQEPVIRKTQFPRLAVPLAVVLTGLFNLALNLVAVVVFLLATGVEPRWSWFGFVLVLVLFTGLTTAVSMLVAALYPRFRDMAIIWTVASTVLFYGSPVLYPLEKAPDALRDILLLNPVSPLLELARKWIIDPTAPGPAAVAGGWTHLLPAIAIYVLVCVLAVVVFRREAPRVAEVL